MILNFDLGKEKLIFNRGSMDSYEGTVDVFWKSDLVDIFYTHCGRNEFTGIEYQKHFLTLLSKKRGPLQFLVHNNTVLILNDKVHEFFESHGKFYCLSYKEKIGWSTKILSIKMDDDFGLYFKMAYL